MKTLGWIRYKKGMNFGKMFGSLQTDSAYNAPFDTVRKSGSSKKKVFVKELALTSENYTNPLLQEFAVFKLNILSSQEGITPMGFDSLIFMNAESPFDGYSLAEIMNRIDTVLTLWKTKTLPGGISAAVGTTQLEQLRKMLNQINGAFDTTLALSLGDSVVAGVGLQFPGITPLIEVPFLQMEMPGRSVQGKEFSQSNMKEKFTLLQNYPNPFNPKTAIGFSLLTDDYVTLKVYNLLGQEVATLLNNETMSAGEHGILFDADELASGIYFYRMNLSGGKEIQMKKLLLLK
jgi:hypothetical protein